MQGVVTSVDTIVTRAQKGLAGIEEFPKLDELMEDSATPIETIYQEPVYGVSYYSIKNSRRTNEDRMAVYPTLDKVFGVS
jgi:hypothetical protein